MKKEIDWSAAMDFDDQRVLRNIAYVIGSTRQEAILFSAETGDLYYMPCELDAYIPVGCIEELDKGRVKRLEDADETVRQRVEKVLETL